MPGLQATGAVDKERLLRAIAPATIAPLAFTSLTHTEFLAANTIFDDTASGIYGAGLVGLGA